MPRKTKPVTVLVKVIVKRAKIEFAPGLGVGVLATQQVTFQVPEDYSPALLASSIHEFGRELVADSVEVQYEEIK
jgi:hypothetical protein